MSVFVALTLWSWRKWPDPLVDFGRELYVPWQLTTGKVLYRDIASLFGPASSYINALWFKLFGVSLTTLIVCNLAILGATIAGIYYLIASTCDRLTATAATMVTLTVFGFSQYVEIGNYNFITPYSHEATHSIALSVAVILCLSHGFRGARRWPFVVGGLAFGLLLLTKVETSVAMLVGVAVGFGGWLMLGADVRGTVRNGSLLFIGFGILPPLVFAAYFSSYMPLATAARAMAVSWTVPLATGVARNEFYTQGMGLDTPVNNSLRMLTVFLGFAVVIGLAAALDRFWPACNVWRGPLSQPAFFDLWRLAKAIGLRIARLGVLVLGFAYIPWFEVPRALPLISMSALAAFVWLFVKGRRDPDEARRLLPLLMWSSFAVVLLAKMFLNARVYHYGFYLALPATLVVVIVLFWLLPELLKRAGAHGKIFRAIVGLFLAAGVAAHMAQSHRLYRMKDLQVTSGRDSFWVFGSAHNWQGISLMEAVTRIQRSVPADATISVLPEGVMINYLTRHETPIPYVSVTLPEILAFGEPNIRAALEAFPPDYVLLVFKDVSEYGVPTFGTGSRYGQEIMEWVNRRYEMVGVIGRSAPGKGPKGIELLRRRADLSAIPVVTRGSLDSLSRFSMSK